MSGTLSLVVRRTIEAPPARLFDAWVTAAQLQAWWGPKGVRCTSAEVEPRVGGKFRIANALPDGRTLLIVGEFLEFVPPERLVYTWQLEPGPGPAERVTVRFEARGTATEVIVVHERITDPAAREQHALGWEGCLDGLARYV